MNCPYCNKVVNGWKGMALNKLVKTNFNLPPGCSRREIEDPTPSAEAEQCNGPRCEVMVEPDDHYYATPCGTFCVECMDEHMRECPSCREEMNE